MPVFVLFQLSLYLEYLADQITGESGRPRDHYVSKRAMHTSQPSSHHPGRELTTYQIYSVKSGANAEAIEATEERGQREAKGDGRVPLISDLGAPDATTR